MYIIYVIIYIYSVHIKIHGSHGSKPLYPNIPKASCCNGCYPPANFAMWKTDHFWILFFQENHGFFTFFWSCSPNGPTGFLATPRPSKSPIFGYPTHSTLRFELPNDWFMTSQLGYSSNSRFI